MKKLGITINGVLRDFHGQFEKYYRKEFIKNEALVQMDENFYAVEEGENEDEFHRLSQLERELITTPIDTFDLMNHFRFDDKESFDKFLYQDYTFPIFGAAPAMPRAFDYLLRIQDIGEVNKMFEIVIISQEKSQAVTSTLHFLAKNGCRARNIKFVDNYSDAWKFCDVVVSETPEVFESKPDGKVSIKINKLYNQWSDSDYTFESLAELNDKDLLVKLFVDKQLDK
jgi:hypothetical protein